MSELTPKQQAFVNEYLIDFNGTQAAIRAGYAKNSANEQAARLLANVNVRQQVEKTLEAQGANTGRVLAELLKVAFSDVSEYLDILPGGEIAFKAFEDMAPGITRALQAVEEDEVITEAKDGATLSKKTKRKIRLHDKLKALELVGKYLGMFSDRLKVSGDAENPIIVKDYSQLTEKELDQLLKKHHG